MTIWPAAGGRFRSGFPGGVGARGVGDGWLVSWPGLGGAGFWLLGVRGGAWLSGVGLGGAGSMGLGVTGPAWLSGLGLGWAGSSLLGVNGPAWPLGLSLGWAASSFLGLRAAWCCGRLRSPARAMKEALGLAAHSRV